MKKTILAVLATAGLATGAAWHGLAADAQKALERLKADGPKESAK